MADSLSKALIYALFFLVITFTLTELQFEKKGIEMYWGAVFLSDIFRCFFKTFAVVVLPTTRRKILKKPGPEVFLK